MELSKISDHPTPAVVVVDSDSAHEIPVNDEVAGTKIETVDKHGAIDHPENPPPKRIKSSLSKNVEVKGPAAATQPAEGAVIRERRKGIAPIKAESVKFEISS